MSFSSRFARPLLLLLLVTSVPGETQFLRPPAYGPPSDYTENPVYELGDAIQVAWTMDFTICNLSLIQVNVVDEEASVGQRLPQAMTARILHNYTYEIFTWVVSYDNFPAYFDEGQGNVFRFYLKDAERETRSTFSHYFNVTRPVASAFPDVPEASESANDTTVDTTITTTTAATSAAESDCMSTAVLVGISVGATIGGLIIIAGIVFLVWRSRLRERSTSITVQTSMTVDELPGTQAYELPETQVHEMAA